jgi:hypothetical protein
MNIEERTSIRGSGLAVVRNELGIVTQIVPFDNLVTQVGDQFYGERAAGVASPPAAVTGMQLGTGSTAPAKTGAGAAIVALAAASLVALTGTPTSALNGSSRRIVYTALWAAGVATVTGLNEVALVNQSTGTQTVAPAANTIARALLSPVVNKGANDTLTVIWNHDLLGA